MPDGRSSTVAEGFSGMALRFRGHTGLVRAVAVDADGSVVASGGADGVLRLWSGWISRD
jgi:WD40 repeat protein